MRKQTIKKNLLIVCEGEITEPFYFKILADRAIENGEWDNVEIVPKPRLSENEDEKAWKSSKRPKRMFKNLDVKLPERRIMVADETERKYASNGTWATPLRFVKEARDRFTEGVFDETWVVFDRNGHPALEAAFALAAEKDKPVNIAFSSRSFEQWVLLHFEKSLLPFEATECKVRQKGQNIQLGCMSNKPLEGSCEGDKCLVGYIRRNHLADYNKKGSFGIVKIFEKLTHTDMIHSALINAAWLQAQQHTHLKANDNKPYLINPYTTVDALVKRLLGIQEMIKWVELGELVKTSHFMLIFEIISENSLKITFTNQRKTSFILNQKYIAENCYCLDNQNIRYRLNLEIPFNLSPNETGFCLLTLPEGNWRSLNLHFKIDEHHIILSL